MLGAVAIIVALGRGVGGTIFIDKRSWLIFYPPMRKQQNRRFGSFHASRLVAFSICGAAGLTGCSVTPLAAHTAAFAKATTVVVNSSEDAYRKANSLYFEEQTSAAVLKYDSSPTWDPHSIKPLLTDQQLKVRYTLLDGLKEYAKNLDTVENAPKNMKGLGTASEGLGTNLMTLSTDANSVLAGGGISGLSLTQAQANNVSTAAYALGEFLAYRKVKGRLPQEIVSMDPAIDTLCKVLVTDIAKLEQQADNDYSMLLTQEDVFIRTSHGMTPMERRTEIARLPRILQRQKTTHELMDELTKAIQSLALTHHALASAAQGHNPEALKARIADLEAIGSSLATYYSSLPAS
ncbi:hypothetical protein AciX9_0606 [Granulicella tundricola MP5ACTX9]|uniref:Uncharacterized protein n=1 Tax=Granulicella tundricola (strain ATCC BAA-1859 / DSM 23138 / MP5ACTX9) TaxID=1198114 RepID=E8WZ75_GRATM|nr:hypothetical protein AciX9_0606 [Granulicella tundricola MP5ACTX9]